MSTLFNQPVAVKSPGLNNREILRFPVSWRAMNVVSMSSVVSDATTCISAANYIPAAPILLPDGPWEQISGGVTAAKGFKAAGIYGGLRAQGEKPDLALISCDVDAVSAVLIIAGEANAATGDAAYQKVLDCASSLAEMLQFRQEEVLVESTGVTGLRTKKKALLEALPKLVSSLSSTIEGANSAAVAITTTDIVSKSVAIESKVGESCIRIGGMAAGYGIIHPHIATTLGVITTDAAVDSDIWRNMVELAVSRSFNQITVDGDTSIIALASGLSGAAMISNLNGPEASQLQSCLDAVMQGLAKSIAWDGKGATCLIEWA